MVISELVIDSSTNHPIVILKEVDGKRTLPIWIGILEANAIATALEGIKLLRPMTHDLLKNIMELLDVKVDKIEINDLKDNTYYARIHINYKGKEVSIDSRPSDAIALSLRVTAPIYVAEEVLNKSAQVTLKVESEDKSDQEKKWRKILEKLDPKDLGKA